LLGAAVIAASCGRLGFDEKPPVVDDAAVVDAAPIVDGSGSAMPLDCWAAWHANPVPLGSAVKLTTLDTQTDNERDPSPSDDGLTLFYTSGSAGAVNATAMMRSSRLTASSPFEAPVAIPALASKDVSKLAIGGADTEVVVSGAYGSARTAELWTTAKAGPAAPIGHPIGTYTVLLDNPNHQLDPMLSANALVLYYSELTTSLTAQIILRSARPAVELPFLPPVPVVTGSPASVGDPAVTPDELVMLYTERATMKIAMSTRPTVEDLFTRVGPVPVLDAFPNTHDGALSRDGCELFFSSTRDGTYDVYEARIAVTAP
jgi:hypothetical protein